LAQTIDKRGIVIVHLPKDMLRHPVKKENPEDNNSRRFIDCIRATLKALTAL
jgi:hypothetical protein